MRFAILTPSHFAQNRLLIERTFHNRLIYSFFGSTHKSFIWSQLSSTVMNNYIWKNFYYYFILIVLLVMMFIIIRWNLLIFNFPIKYWFVYIWWRMFDGFYFFFLQIQYLLVLCILSSSWYVLNTYFNIQLNLLYLIIFNFFNTTLDIQHTTSHIDNLNLLYKSSLSHLFKQNLTINSDLFSVLYYFYRSMFCLNILNVSMLSWRNSMLNASIWSNFIIFVNMDYRNLHNSPYSLSNQVPFAWFKSLNLNTAWGYRCSYSYSMFIKNWYDMLRVLRWDFINCSSYSGSPVDLKSIVNNFYFNNNMVVGLTSWVLSLEWFLFRNSLSSSLRTVQVQLSDISNSEMIVSLGNQPLRGAYNLLNYMLIFNNYTLLVSNNVNNTQVAGNNFYYTVQSFLNLSSFFSYKTLCWYSSWLSTGEIQLPVQLFDTVFNLNCQSKFTNNRIISFIYYF